MKPRVQIVDDDPGTQELLTELLKKQFTIYTLGTGDKVLETIKKNRPQIVILDLILPGKSGIDVLKDIRNYNDSISVIIISGRGTVQTAVLALKLGAEDFIEKPFVDLELIRIAVGKALVRQNYLQENESFRKYIDSDNKFPFLIGVSPGILKLKKMIEQVATIDSTVLITGETGTGKELVARAVHTLSLRKDKPFVPVHCGGIPDTLLESALFGHEKGAFTGAVKSTKGHFEVAQGGSIFLDEIGETTPAFQVKILRVLQELKIQRVGDTHDIDIDVRLISATNRELEEEVKEGVFRQDLFYRLNVIHLWVPPLRERREDIQILANHFLAKYAAHFNRPIPKISSQAMSRLKNHDWPGNVRELENMMERLVALSQNGEIKSADVNTSFSFPRSNSNISSFFDMPYRSAKNSFEWEYIKNILKKSRGNVAQAALYSGIPRQNLYLKIKKFGISTKEVAG